MSFKGEVIVDKIVFVLFIIGWVDNFRQIHFEDSFAGEVNWDMSELFFSLVQGLWVYFRNISVLFLWNSTWVNEYQDYLDLWPSPILHIIMFLMYDYDIHFLNRLNRKGTFGFVHSSLYTSRIHPTIHFLSRLRFIKLIIVLKFITWAIQFHYNVEWWPVLSCLVTLFFV